MKPLNMIITCTLIVVIAGPPAAVAWGWNQTQLTQNVDTLQQNVQLLQLQLPNDITVPSNKTTCPVCTAQSSQSKSGLDRLIPEVLAKGQSLVRKTSTFAGLKRLLRTPLGRRRYRKQVAVGTLISSLSLTASQLTTWAHRASQRARDDGISAGSW